MKALRLFLGGVSVLALLILAACADEPDEARCAQLATVSCDDSSFTVDATGGTAAFPTEGNSLVLNVDCGTDWEALNDSPEWMTANVSVNAGTLTLVAAQNTVEKERTATVTLQTAASGVRFATINITQTAYGAPTISTESADWRAPAVGALTTTIGISASEEWKVASVSETWLTAEKTDEGLALTAAENDDTEERIAEVVVSCTDGIETPSLTITVTQDAHAYITLESETLSLTGEAQTATMTVESNYDWTVSYDANNGWFTISSDTGKIIVTVTENETEGDREGTVSLTAGDGVENTAEAQLSISQAKNSIPLILTYTTTDANTLIQIPLSGTVDCTVNWGDGTVEAITSSLPSHTYAEAGEYDVTVDGTVTALKSSDITASINSMMTAVKQWGLTGLTSMAYGLYKCDQLKSLPEDTRGAFAEVTTFDNAFYRCTSLEKLPAGLLTYCSKVETFYDAFAMCSSMTEVGTGAFDNCAACTSFENVFYQDTSLETVPEGLFANCTNATTFKQAFRLCSALTTVPKNLFANCSNVTTFDSLFRTCSKITSIPDGLFDDCTSATAFDYVFNGCQALTSLPDGLFSKCTAAKTFTYAFQTCKLLESIPADLFSGCTEITSFEYAFHTCSALKSIPTGLFADCAKVTTFKYTFYNCTALTSIPEGLFDACTEVTTFTYCFSGCSGLTSIPSALFNNNRKVTVFSYTFQNCTSLTGESPYEEIEIDGESVHVHLYERYATNGAYNSYYPDLKKAITGTKCYDNCTGLSDHAAIKSAGWCTCAVE